MELFLNWLMNIIEKIGYPGVFICMTIESTFIPLPSEVIIPPAGYLASQGKMNIVIVILCGTLGSVFGALINYWISIKVGRAIIIKWGKYFKFPESRFLKVEKYFNEHGAISTFIGRLVLGLRHYISIPAGLTKMRLDKFVFYTFLGAAIWNTILAYIGYTVGNNLQLIKDKSHEISLYVLGAVVLLIIVYVGLVKRKKTVENEK